MFIQIYDIPIVGSGNGQNQEGMYSTYIRVT
jgi:hypothetical protein